MTKSWAFFFFIALFSLSSCTFYRSEGRKRFEDAAPSEAVTATSLQKCETLNKIESWLTQEFPTQSYELVFSDYDLEVWKHPLADQSIEVKTLQKISGGVQSCTYLFADENIWNLYRENFIDVLLNNMNANDDTH